METLYLVGLIAGIWSLAYFRVPLLIWTALVATGLLFCQVTGAIGWSGLLIWPVFLAIAVPLNLKTIRKNSLTRPAFAIFRKVLPPMSDTEREAIEAGNVWWEGKLFQGRPTWSKWLKTQLPSLTPEEQGFLDHEVEHLLGMFSDWEVSQQLKDLPPDVWTYLKEKKFFGMIIPKQYGGLEFSATAHSKIITRIASKSPSLAVTTMVPNSLGPAELLIKYGTQKQKDHYLPRLATGVEIPCFGLTGVNAGSDAGSISDTGIVCKGQYAGKEVLGIRLNWDKRYITLAPVATVLGLAFKLFDPDHLLGEQESLGITLCLIPTNTSGVQIGQRHSPLGVAFMNGPTQGRDVFIPIDWIIGGREMAGQGWRMLMECLSIGRSISLPALATAVGSMAYTMTGAYSQLREQFRVPIGDFEGVQEHLAEIAGYTYMLESSRVVTASSVDLGNKPSVTSAIAKYHMTELGRTSLNRAMDVHGGKAIIEGPLNSLASLYHATPITITVEGANILTRSLMIFGQGAIRCHPYVQDEIMCSQEFETDPDGALTKFDKIFWGHIGYFVSNFFRTLWMGLTGGFLSVPAKRDGMYRYFQKINWYSSALALTSDVAMMILGGKLKFKETLSARLGDVLSHLYLGTAVLKHYYDNGAKKEDREHVRWALEYCLSECQTAFYDFFRNFPPKAVGLLLKVVCFPFGAHGRKPTDKLSQTLAKQMMQPTDLRDRIATNVFAGGQGNEGAATVELAYKKMIEVKPFLDKVSQAVRAGEIGKGLSLNERLKVAVQKQILDVEGRKKIIEFEKLRAKVIAVDDFTKDYLSGNNNAWKTKNITLKAERFSS